LRSWLARIIFAITYRKRCVGPRKYSKDYNRRVGRDDLLATTR
jgi:hypothetical protein